MFSSSLIPVSFSKAGSGSAKKIVEMRLRSELNIVDWRRRAGARVVVSKSSDLNCLKKS